MKYTSEYFAVKEKEEQISKLKEEKEKTEKEVSQIIERDQQKIEKGRDWRRARRLALAAATGRENQLRAMYMNEMSAANVQGQAETRLTTLICRI